MTYRCAVNGCPDLGDTRVADEEDGTEYWFCEKHVEAYCEPREP